MTPLRVRRARLYCYVLGLGLLLAGCAFGGTAESITTESSLSGSLPVSAPETAEVGTTVTVSVGPVEAPDNTTVNLVTIGSYGMRLYQELFTGGSVQFVLPPEHTAHSGVVTLLASSGGARGTTTLTLEPGRPVGPITPLVGARTIVADGKHWSMTTVVPFDALGNPVAEGTPINIRALHPGQNLEEQVVRVQHLLAWARIYSGTRAGRTTITARTEQAFGPEEVLLEVAGWPVPFAITADPRTLPANGRDLVVLRTDVMHDRFGNVLPDGTLVTFVVEEPDQEPRRIPAYTIQGQAEARLQAPLEPGIANVRGVVYSVESEPLRITFTAGPAVGTFPVTAEVSAELGAVVLGAGPLLAQLDQYVPDGTPVSFVVTGPDGWQQELIGVADRGYAAAELRLEGLEAGTYSVEAISGAGSGSTSFTLPAD